MHFVATKGEVAKNVVRFQCAGPLDRGSPDWSCKTSWGSLGERLRQSIANISLLIPSSTKQIFCLLNNQIRTSHLLIVSLPLSLQFDPIQRAPSFKTKLDPEVLHGTKFIRSSRMCKTHSNIARSQFHLTFIKLLMWRDTNRYESNCLAKVLRSLIDQMFWNDLKWKLTVGSKINFYTASLGKCSHILMKKAVVTCLLKTRSLCIFGTPIVSSLLLVPLKAVAQDISAVEG